MTTPFLITGTFDAAAPDFSLANPDQILATTSQTRVYTPADPIGLIDLSTLNPGIANYWCWCVSWVGDDVVNTNGNISLFLQNGAQQDVISLVPGTQLPPEWNLLCPQGSKLGVLVDDGGGTASGSFYFTLTGVAADDWYRLQCCHRFAPLPPTGGGPA